MLTKAGHAGYGSRISDGTARIRTHRVQMGRGFPAIASFGRVLLLCPQICQFPPPDVPPNGVGTNEMSNLVSVWKIYRKVEVQNIIISILILEFYELKLVRKILGGAGVPNTIFRSCSMQITLASKMLLYI